MSGTARRDAAIESMMEKAKDWMALALPAVVDFLDENRGKLISGEDITNVAAAVAGAPHHPNVFGGLYNALVKANLLKRTAKWKQMQKESSHARRTPLWKVK